MFIPFDQIEPGRWYWFKCDGRDHFGVAEVRKDYDGIVLATDSKMVYFATDPVTDIQRIPTQAEYNAMVETLKAIDDDWTEYHPAGPDSPELPYSGKIAEQTVKLWKRLRTAIAAAEGTSEATQ